MATNRSVDRALSVLTHVARSRTPRRFSDLATETGLPKSTLHSLLASLESAGFLDKTAVGYRVGISAFEVGTALPLGSSLRNEVAPILDELASVTGEACHFGMLSGADVVYLDRRDTGEGLRLASRIGQRLPAHATALGKAMLAALPPDEVRRRLPRQLVRVTPRTIVDEAQLMLALQTIRDEGFARESEESTPGVCCIGIAFSTTESILGISVSVPVQRMEVEDLPRFMPLLSDAATKIGRLAAAHEWRLDTAEGYR